MHRDSLWKGILEEVFDDLLRFVFPNADELFDLNRRRVFLDKEFASLYPDGHRIPDCYAFNFAGTEIRYKYNVMRINQFRDEELASNPNPFAAVVLVAKAALACGKVTERTLIARKFALAKRLMARGDIPKRKLATILAFLNRYVVFRKKASSRVFKEKVQSIKNKNETMGLLEMLELEYKEQVIKRFLRRGTSSDADIAYYVGVRIAIVQKIRKELAAKKARRKARK